MCRRPYPPGQDKCPEFADGMAPHERSGNNRLAATCSEPPCAASLLGDVGRTTVSGKDARSGITFSPGENIYGPFEAGFTSRQDDILANLGCNPGSLGHVAGGIDVYTAEQMVAKQCSIKLPREEGGQYISLLDECGGHTREYHFHERLTCLYAQAGGHSTQVGKGSDTQGIYGKWEDFASKQLPQLDACGGHFGIIPDSNGEVTYHYHVQDKPPFIIGCFGPRKNGTTYHLVTVKECRAAYSGCGDNDAITAATPTGSVQYDLWCPCYDADGSNVASKELPVFSNPTAVTTCTKTSCTSFQPVSEMVSASSRMDTCALLSLSMIVLFAAAASSLI
eukprot:TRINITY_DN17198_c0_g1_i1.p1 TRINITY_DN17198_c0_g1~~TRINITY_DN17198_c0_g1_i1.p1  ORF type:complete len:336 (+),score=41.25 TRINITY_DN17198_c0_g1_i1:119-1126(+)